jgi:outer membrane protein
MNRSRTTWPTFVRFLFLSLAFCISADALDHPGQETAGTAGILTLREAVRLALARGPEVYLAQAEAARAAEALRETRSMNLPQIVTGTGLAYNNGFPLSIEGAAPSIVQLGVSQSIFSKKNKSLILEAENGSLASQAGTDGVRNGLVAKTILLYSELHRARLAVPILEKQLETAAKNLQIIEALLEAGKARPLDRTQAKVAAANLDQQLLMLRERVRLAETGLRELTGIPEGDKFRTETPEIKSELLTLSTEMLYQKALEVHPQIREAQATLRAKELHVQSEQADRYPQFNLIGEYALFSRTNNYQDYFNRFSRNNYLLGVSIQVPLFNGFRTDARVAQSRHDAEAAKLRLQQLKSDLKLNLERGMSDLRVARGAAELARLEVTACEEKMQINETLMEAGRLEPKDLENARAQLLERQIAVIEAERTLFERQVVLLQASGSLATLF